MKDHQMRKQERGDDGKRQPQALQQVRLSVPLDAERGNG